MLAHYRQLKQRRFCVISSSSQHLAWCCPCCSSFVLHLLLCSTIILFSLPTLVHHLFSKSTIAHLYATLQ
ncbi:hypothetical protein RJT34_04783 [Clitoria ternatea]|uniref:Uncharacterized protein n=1 Tax=Clitoria ternatea TaxID=43366 RepID=A0AAN9KPR1_CLITE